MLADRSYEGLLERLLAPRIGERPLGLPRRVHAFVERASRATGESRFSLLEAMLAGRHPELLEGLIDAATVGHTAFFRHPVHFEHLRGLLPQLGRARGRTLELWCAGCSTGEEAYSLALCADELGVSVRILATDVNPRAIQTAREGRYKDSPLATTGSGPEEWVAPDRLKRAVRFEQASITSDTPAPEAARFDLIFCRNVLIYFDRASVSGILERLAQYLAAGGAIVVSPADAVLPLPSCLTWNTPAGWLKLCSENLRVPSPKVTRIEQRELPELAANDAEPPVSSAIEHAARLLQSGRRDEAERMLCGLLNQDPAAVAAWFLLGEALLRRGEHVQAQLAFRRASGLKASTEGIDLDDPLALTGTRRGSR